MTKKFSKKSFLFLLVVVMIAAVICGCGQNKDPKETEPAVTTEKVVTTAPQETEPPVVTTEEPVVTTAEPVVTTAEQPVVTTAKPVVTTAEQPVVTTAEQPVVTTAKPVVTTAKPVVTTAKPVVTTAKPSEPSDGGLDYPSPPPPPLTTRAPATSAPAETSAPEGTDVTTPVITAPVTTAEPLPLETYYPLYVQDGLLYHMNFASATEDMVINPANPDAELANLKFAAAADTFDPFVIYAKEGITNKIWAGGTATIAEGGWKFTTPFVYDYWFDAEGNFKTSRPGPASTFDHFVTEEGVAGAPYYMNGDAYVKAEASRTIGGVTKPLYQLVHTAPEGATGYYIPQGIWASPTYSSAFGNGYFDAAKGNDIKIYNALNNILPSANAFSVELVAASVKNSKAAFFIGPRFEFTPKADSVSFVGSVGYEMLATDSGYQTITMTLNGQKVNTYTFAFDLADIANKNYVLDAYGNGKNSAHRTLSPLLPHSKHPTSSS